MQVISPAADSIDPTGTDLEHGPLNNARFLEPQSLVSIVRNSLAIYLKNWRTIFLIYVIPLLPLVVLHAIFAGAGLVGLAALVMLVRTLTGLLLGAVITVLISDVCLGFRPGVGRSYRRAFANAGRLLGTYFLGFLVICGGMLLLLVPGIICSMWYMFNLPIAVLEQLSGRAALRRSRVLGRGCYLRNYGVIILIVGASALLSYLVAYIIAYLGGAVFGISPARIVAGAFEVVDILTVSPFLSIPGILLYYDMRARKDGYAAPQLLEELRI